MTNSDSLETISNHGGSREGAGRKPLDSLSGEPVSRVPVTLRESQKQYLANSLGGIAKGVRALIDADMGLRALPDSGGFSAEFLSQAITAIASARERGVSDDEIIRAINDATGSARLNALDSEDAS